MALAVVLADRPHLLRSLVHVILGALRGRSPSATSSGCWSTRPTTTWATRRSPAASARSSSTCSPRWPPARSARSRWCARTSPTRCRASRSRSRSCLRSRVTGLLLEAGRTADAAESTLLFLTNVAAIIATGTAGPRPRAGSGPPRRPPADPVGRTSRRDDRARWSGCWSSSRSRWPRAPCAWRATSTSRRPRGRSPRSGLATPAGRSRGSTALNGLVTVERAGPAAVDRPGDAPRRLRRRRRWPGRRPAAPPRRRAAPASARADADACSARCPGG